MAEVPFATIRGRSQPACAPAPPDSSALCSALLRSEAGEVFVIDSHGILIWSNRISGDPFDGNDRPALGTILGTHWSSVPRTEFADAVASATRVGNARLTGSTISAGGRRRWDIQLLRLDIDPLRQGHIAVVVRELISDPQAGSGQRRPAARDACDALTGLARRDAFYSRLEELMAETEQVPFSVIMIDIDRLRIVNNVMGHDTGDKVLRRFGKRLVGSMRPGDVSSRLGGDEFGIIVCDGDGADRADRLVERLRRPIRIAGNRVDWSLSVGYACYPQDGDTAMTLCQNAEAALYEAKAFGQGCTIRSDGGLREAEHARRAMLVRAERVLANNAIVAHYQPKIDLALGSIVGFEALLRWRSDNGVMEPPSTIWAALTDSQLSRRITDTMLDQVFADLVRWQRAGITFPVAINVSDSDLRHGDFADRLLQRLADAGLPASSIEVEITETVFLGRETNHLVGMLSKLNAACIRIALDDFGTGYASLSHLLELPVDVIKIDRSFISKLRKDPGDRAIVEAMLALARRLMIEVVAEGIEHDDEIEFLRDHGCQMGQGYLFSQAVMASEVPAMIARLGPLSYRSSHKTRDQPISLS